MSDDTWQRKIVRDAALSKVPVGLRQQIEQERRSGPVKQPKSIYQKMREMTTAGLGSVSPRPMLVTQVPATEIVPDEGYGIEAITSPGTDDGHEHVACYDAAGNGETDEVEGHCHSIRSFQVVPYQDPAGIGSHGHPGLLPRSSVATDAEKYTGELSPGNKGF